MGRLLIEQQTFGATRTDWFHAVTQLRMFSPPAAQTVVISFPMTSKARQIRHAVWQISEANQYTKKQQSISGKPTLALDMWRFYLLWERCCCAFVVVACFLCTGD